MGYLYLIRNIVLGLSINLCHDYINRAVHLVLLMIYDPTIKSYKTATTPFVTPALLQD